MPNTTLLIVALAIILSGLVVGVFIGRSWRNARWSFILIDSALRGPNADTGYFILQVEDRRYLFTREQVSVAFDRADKLKRHLDGPENTAP